MLKKFTLKRNKGKNITITLQKPDLQMQLDCDKFRIDQ